MATDTTQPPFSENTLDFTPEKARITLPTSESWAFGESDFTIEAWIHNKNLVDTPDFKNDRTIFGSMQADKGNQFLFYVTDSGKLAFWNGRTSVGGGTLSNDTWHHVALVRRNLRLYMYLDGRIVYSGCHLANHQQMYGYSVGAVYDPYVNGNKWTRFFDGYMQDVRVTHHAVYTCNFHIPDALLYKCSADERCPTPCYLYINYDFNMPWYMGGRYANNTHPIEVEKNQDSQTISHIFMTTQKAKYGPGTNTGTIRNVKISTSSNGPWTDVTVNLATRKEEIYSANTAYTAISFDIEIPKVTSDCQISGDEEEPWPWPTPTPIPAGVTVIDIISDPTTGNDEDDPYIEPEPPGIVHVNSLLGFGSNASGQLGLGTTTNFESNRNGKPVVISDDLDIVKIEGSYNHTLMLASNGEVYGSGSNDKGQLGDGGSTNTPIKIKEDVADISVGYKCSLILDADGTLYATGNNELGEIGLGDASSTNSFTEVLTDVIKISTGAKHSFAIKSDGSLWATGRNTYGQLGLGHTDDVKTFTKVLDGDVLEASAGGHHSLIIKTDGSLWSCGSNMFGQLGNGVIDDWDLKEWFAGPKNISDHGHTVTWDKDDSSQTFADFYESLTTDNDESQFIKVIDTDCKRIVSGTLTSFVIKQDDALYVSGLKSEWDWLNLFGGTFADYDAFDPGASSNDAIVNGLDISSVSSFNLIGYDFRDVKVEIEYSDDPKHDFDFAVEDSTKEETENDSSSYRNMGQQIGSAFDPSKKLRFVLFLHKNGNLYGQGVAGDAVNRVNIHNQTFTGTKRYHANSIAFTYVNVAFKEVGSRNDCPLFMNKVKRIGVGHNSFFCYRSTNLPTYNKNLSDTVEVYANDINGGTYGNASVFSFQQMYSLCFKNENISYIDSNPTGTYFVKSDGSLWGSGADFYVNPVNAPSYFDHLHGTAPAKTTSAAIAGENYENKILGQMMNKRETNSDRNAWYNSQRAWSQSFKDTKSFESNIFEILPAPSDDESKVIKVATSRDHLLILHKNQTLWSAGNNNDGQCGIDISDGAFIQYQQTTHSNITDIFTELNISYVIDSARRLKRLNGENTELIASDVLKFTEDGCYITLSNEYHRIDGGLLAEDVIDATDGQYILKSDGSIYDIGANGQSMTLLHSDEEIVALYSGLEFLTKSGALWSLDVTTKSIENIFEDKVSFVRKEFVIRNNEDILPEVIEYTPTPVTTPTPTPTPGPVLFGTGLGPIGDNTVVYRTNAEIMRGLNVSDLFYGDICNLVILESGEVYGWRSRTGSTGDIVANYWGGSTTIDPFAPTEFDAHLFPNGMKYKPMLTILQDVKKIVSANPDSAIYQKKSDNNFYIIGKFGNIVKTSPELLYPGTTEVYEDLMFIESSKEIRKFSFDSSGTITTEVIETGVDKFLGKGYGGVVNNYRFMSMLKEDGIYYIKSNEIYYKFINSSDVVKYGDASGVVKVYSLPTGVICFLTDTGELFSYYVNVNSTLTRSTGQTWNPHWTDTAKSWSGNWGAWGGYTVNVSAPIKITWDSNVDRLLPYNYVLKKNGKIHELETRSQHYLNAPSKMQIALTKNPITDANLIFEGRGTYSYYESK